MSEAVVSFRGVSKRFGSRLAVEDAEFELAEGTTLGIVGESGSGKTTCVRLAIGLERPTAGTLLFHGRRYPRSRRRLRRIRRRVGLVQQDPYDSLDPRMTIGDIVAEPLRLYGGRGREVLDRAAAALAAAGLPNAALTSYPRAYSGGGRQRIAIARALALDPEVLLCDEPTASLDVSVQAQIVNLLLDLRESRGLSMIFVSHDLDLIRRVATDIVVMYAGRVVESGPAAIVAERPLHPYTSALLASIPGDHPERRKVVGARSAAVDSGEAEVADEAEPDRDACVFAPRCPKAQDVCRAAAPPVSRSTSGVLFRCYFPEGSEVEARDGVAAPEPGEGLRTARSGT
jgi:oligopeptide/dipeptide ABC transporter ATP-binding protein